MLFAAVVGAALSGLLGVTTGRVTAEGQRTRLGVEYPRVARPGLAVPLTIRVALQDGTARPDTVEVVVPHEYLALFDRNGLDPEPVAASSSSAGVVWSFTVPASDRDLLVVLDVRVEPSVQWGRAGTVTVRVDGRADATARLRTWVLP